MPSSLGRIAVNLILIVLLIGLLVSGLLYNRIDPADREEAPRSNKPFDIMLEQAEISSLAIQGDILWAGGWDGVYQIDWQAGTYLGTLPAEPPIREVKTVYVDSKGSLWVAHARGLARYDGATVINLTRQDGLPGERVNTVLEDHAGRLWVGTWEGLLIMEQGNNRVLTVKEGLLDNMVNILYQDRAGGMWIGSYTAPRGGVSHYQDDSWQYFSTRNGLPHNNITAIAGDHIGNVWLGMGLHDRGGAAVLAMQAGMWEISRILQQADGLAGAKVRSVFEDSRKILWLGSEYDGLALFAGDRTRIITVADGLSDNEVKSILEDKDGNIWLGTRKGITRLKPDDVQALLE